MSDQCRFMFQRHDDDDDEDEGHEEEEETGRMSRQESEEEGCLWVKGRWFESPCVSAGKTFIL